MKLLIAKKGVASKGMTVMGVVAIAMCVLMFATGLTDKSWRDSELTGLFKVMAPILLLFAGVLFLAIAPKYGKTYIRLYEDRVEGVGMVGMAAQSFCFTSGYTVQMQGSRLWVSHGGSKYLVALTKEDAQAVYNCANGIPYTQQTGQEPPKQQPKQGDALAGKVVVTCPYCASKSAVPKGKGRIRITCHGCGKQFERTT